MKNSEIEDLLFRQAVESLDEGDMITLENLIAANPRLVRDPLKYPVEGYFKNPYLLWFVADNPIRVDRLASNILDITAMLIRYVKQGADNVQDQLDYALGLVSTGRIPKEAGVQINLMDLLIDEGANPGSSIGALAHGNIDAVKHLIKRGATMSLSAAVGLSQMDDVIRLTSTANQEEKLLAMTVAAFYGNTDMISYLLGAGASVNGYPQKESGFHSHATPLHQAVWSGSHDAVRLLVDSGARLDAKDSIFHGTPLGWAEHMTTDSDQDDERKKYQIIARYLRANEAE